MPGGCTGIDTYSLHCLYGGYYTVTRRHEFYVRVARTISHEWAQQKSEILILPREHKIHIFGLTCNVLFLYINILMTALSMIFRRLPTSFRRFSKIFQNCSESQTNVPKHFPRISEDFRRMPKTFDEDPKMFRYTTDFYIIMSHFRT